MQPQETILLAVLFVVLLGGLVSLGIGHRRWSIGTVVAGFLVLLAAVTYLYFAAQLAHRERAWARKVADYQARLAKAEHDRQGDPRAEGWEEGPESLGRLRSKRDRWRRGLDRIDTWRDRHWDKASFQPPKDDASPGRIELAAEGNAEDSPPIGVGAHVFLFDMAPFEEGGVYLGEFLVQATAFDEAGKRHVLTVVQTSPRDAYDTQVLRAPHDSVTVYETLPVDRWLAFYRSRERRIDDAEAIEPDKQDPDKIREVLESSPQVGSLVQRFVDTFRQHEKDVPRDEWKSAEVAAEAADKPGTVWAEVEFTKPHSFLAEGAAAAADSGPKQDFEPGERMEFDLQTARDLEDDRSVATIRRVFRRRPLTDALTLLHGARSPGGDGVAVEGTATLLSILRDELAALERSNARLKASIDAAQANTDDEKKVVNELRRDLTGTDAAGKVVDANHWRHDVEEAERLAAAFQRELDATDRALREAEAAIVERGRELTALTTRLTLEIDRVAPPPERRAAKP